MRKQAELRWAIFLLVVLIVTVGLFTGFSFRETPDLQFYDTYVVLTSFHLLIFISVVLILAYLLSYGLKRLATVNKTMKKTSVLITGLLSLGLLVFLIIALSYSISSTMMEDYGIVAMILGIAILFALRTREILQVAS